MSLPFLYLLVLSFILVTGCVSVSSSKDPHFYRIAPLQEEEVTTIDLSSDFAVAIGNVKIPEYLNRPHIVTQDDAQQVRFAQFDRWAQPLDEGFTQTIKDNIAHILPRVQVVSYPVDFPSDVAFRLDLEINDLKINLNGDLFLAVSWAVIDVGYPKNTFIKRSEFIVPVKGKGYAGAVNALSIACASLSAEIAQVIYQMSGAGAS